MDSKKALSIAIQLAEQKRRSHQASKDAARYGLRFGVLAKEHYDELGEVIETLEKMLAEILTNKKK